MSLLAEELVEEWLRRDGYFTMRGLKSGLCEFDLLAIKPRQDGLHCRHIEVQASLRPISYICKIPKELQKKWGRAANSAKKRPPHEIEPCVEDWVNKKFLASKRQKIRDSLVSLPWTFELVVHNHICSDELELISKKNVSVIHLKDIIASLLISRPDYSTSGGDFVDLLLRSDGHKKEPGDKKHG